MVEMKSLGTFFNPFRTDISSLKKERDRIRKMDVGHIEILLDHYRFLDPSGNEIKDLKSATSEWDRIIHAPFVNITVVHPNKNITEAGTRTLKSCIEAARVLDSKLVTFHGGAYPFYIEDKELIHDIFNESASELADFADSYGIRMSTENLPPSRRTRASFPSNIEETRKVLEDNPRIGFTLDIGHIIENRENITDYIDEFRSRVTNFHIHDSDGTKSHIGIGKGNIDFQTLMKKLKSTNAYLTLEILKDEDVPDSFNALREMLLQKACDE